MKFTKIRVWKWAALTVLLGASAFCGNLVSLYAYDTAIFSRRFHFDYERSRDQSAFLIGFRARIWEHNGGYIPDDVDDFLITRLEASQSEREIDAVTRFYCFQAGGRERETWRRLSDAARRRIARSVLLNWRDFPPQSAGHAFVWLEELRQNRQIDKANLIVPDGIPNGFADSLEKVAPVAALFERWNRKYAATAFIKRPDPLAGTPYRIQGL